MGWLMVGHIHNPPSPIFAQMTRPSASFSEENISKISPKNSKIFLISTNIILYISTILDYTPRPCAKENISKISPKKYLNIPDIHKYNFPYIHNPRSYSKTLLLLFWRKYFPNIHNYLKYLQNTILHIHNPRLYSKTLNLLFFSGTFFQSAQATNNPIMKSLFWYFVKNTITILMFCKKTHTPSKLQNVLYLN